ncbi:MAG: hypothetical protein R3F17_00630 [Planctomycetota bacterium]
MLPTLLAALLLAVPQESQSAAAAAPQADASKPVVTEKAVRAGYDAAIGYLIASQNPDGSWGSPGPESEQETIFSIEAFYSWRLAAQGIAMRALAGADRSRADVRQARDRGLAFLCDARLPVRDSDWDIDLVWAGIYGLDACVALLEDAEFAGEPWAPWLRARGSEFLDLLLAYQSVGGGFGYYDFEHLGPKPQWSTSFATAAVLPALQNASRVLQREVPAGPVAEAQRLIERCALPNGAFAYDLQPLMGVRRLEYINQIQGSLGRIQVCHQALRKAGNPRYDDEVLRRGLRWFVEEHAVLEHVRTRPIPHEGRYQNAGYFYFFGHYYAAEVIRLLPRAERLGWFEAITPFLLATQWKDGSTSDYLRSPYIVTACTGFLSQFLRAHLDEIEAAAATAPQPAPAGATTESSEDSEDENE